MPAAGLCFCTRIPPHSHPPPSLTCASVSLTPSSSSNESMLEWPCTKRCRASRRLLNTSDTISCSRGEGGGGRVGGGQQ